MTAPSLGDTWVSKRTVTDRMVPGHLAAPILSMPALVMLVEVACLDAVQPSLAASETTVGAYMCISHRAPARVGEELVIESRLAEIDRRRMRFEVVVRGAAGVISEGTHTRAIVTAEDFGQMRSTPS
jgi:predicted thioesterase